MAEQTPIPLYASTFKGIDLRTSSIGKEFNAASVCINLIKNSHGRLTTRPGITAAFSPVNTGVAIAGFYPFLYRTVDLGTNSTVEEIIALFYPMNSSWVAGTVAIYRLVESTMTITYTGSGTGTIAINPDPDNDTQFKVVITANGSTVLDDAIAYDYTNSYTSIKTLRDAVDALSDYAVTSIDSLAIHAPAAVLHPQAQNISLASATTADLTYYTVESVGTVEAPDLVFTDAEFIHPSAENYANNLYFCYGKSLYKYDGHRAYKAGLPQATINALADAGSGSTFSTGDVYIYKILFARTDNKNNIIEGEDSDDTLAVATLTKAASDDNLLTINTLTASTFSNAEAHSAIVNGAQTGVNIITVDSGHTFIVGDKAYFYDDDNNAYVTRKITARAATTITVDGATVGVADNAIISNIRIQIWRTKESDTDFYLVEEIPNDTLNATQQYTDTTTDDNLGEPFQEQVRKHSLPPSCSYVSTHQGLLLVAGDPANPNRASWNLPLNPEAFPLESNFIEVPGGTGPLTGMGSLDLQAVALFKRDYFEIKVGSLDDLVLETLDSAATGIGCTSFRTLQYVGERKSLVGLSEQGPFIFTGRDVSLALSESISPLFDDSPSDLDQENDVEIEDSDINIPLTLRRAVGFNDTVHEIYHLFIPAEYGTPSEFKVPHRRFSKWLFFDYSADVPYWSEIKSSADAYYDDTVYRPYTGFCIYKDKVWFGEVREFSGSTSRSFLSYFKRFENGVDDLDDYMDSSKQIKVHLHYLPIVRQQGLISAFFKPLYISILRFLDYRYRSGSLKPQPRSFSLRATLFRDFKSHSLTSRFSTRADRTFKDENDSVTGTIAEMIKCVSLKMRAAMITITNPNAGDLELNDPYIIGEKVEYDGIEFVYSTPFDKKEKAPKSIQARLDT